MHAKPHATACSGHACMHAHEPQPATCKICHANAHRHSLQRVVNVTTVKEAKAAGWNGVIDAKLKGRNDLSEVDKCDHVRRTPIAPHFGC